MVLGLLLSLCLFTRWNNNEGIFRRFFDVFFLISSVSFFIFFDTSSGARRKLFWLRDRDRLWLFLIFCGWLSDCRVVIPNLNNFYCMSAIFSGWLGYIEYG